MPKESSKGRPASHWFVSDRVLTDAHAPERSLAIGVSHGHVTAIESAAWARQAKPSGVSDFGASPLLPSFVNGHCHLAMAPLRGITSAAQRRGNVVTDVFFELERHLTEVDVFAFTRLGAYESLLSGVGEVWDHYYHGEAVARALAEVGLSGVVAPTLQDESGPGALAWERELEATRKIHDDPDLRARGIRAALGPHASDTVSDGLFERAAQLARDLGLPVHMHLTQAASEIERGRSAGAIVERVLSLLADCSVLFAHGLFLGRAELERLAQASWSLAFCPLSQVQFAFLSPVREWLESGGKLAVGTDCVASNDALSVQRELPWLGALPALEAGFGATRRALLASGATTEVRALEEERSAGGSAALVDGRELLALGLGTGLPATAGLRSGCIELGARANFQILDPEAPELYPGDDLPRRLSYGETSGALHVLVVAGRMIGTPGEFRSSLTRSAHYREVRKEAVRRRAELFARAGVDQ